MFILNITTSAVGYGCRFELIHDRYRTGPKLTSWAVSVWSKSKCPRVSFHS
jgi:hypothetical protein